MRIRRGNTLLILLLVPTFVFLGIFFSAASESERSVPVGEVDGVGVSKIWYFAEGTTREPFQEWISLLNLEGEPSEVVLEYLFPDGERLERRHAVPALKKKIVKASGEVPPGKDFSLVVRSEKPIVAERSIYFDSLGMKGGYQVKGATRASERWLFAEGSVREGFETYLAILNPCKAEALVDVSYLSGKGKEVKRRGIKVEAQSRFTIAVHEPGLGLGRCRGSAGDIGIIVESKNGVQVVSERSMYFSLGNGVVGGHGALGVPQAQSAWYFAEGTNREGFEAFLCFFNPNTSPARVNIEYLLENGGKVERKGLTIMPRARLTVSSRDKRYGLGGTEGDHLDFSTTVASSNGVGLVVECPAYYSYKPFWTGGHISSGSESPRSVWSFSEGCLREGFDTYLSLFNPGEKATEANITCYFGGSRGPDTKSVAIGGNSRATFALAGGGLGFGRHEGDEGDIGVEVETKNGSQIVVEEVIYSAPRWRTMSKETLIKTWGRGEVFAGNTSSTMVALTFDIESSSRNTQAILDILHQKDVHSTMFVTGQFAQLYPETIRKMAFEGHEIANHSMTHPHFTKLTAPEISAEIGTTEGIVQGLTSLSTMPYFRFPYGDRNIPAIQFLNSIGYVSVNWTIDSRDWQHPPAQVSSTVLSLLRGGAIILMHDRDSTVQALPGIIDGIRSRGFVPVTLTELFYPGP
ncbi:MAG: polysaccharide deacetylase family protein [Actinomycetota bacterium]|nr:polysaccharide deacetylase family protein [Actinomycetota bacterium]